MAIDEGALTKGQLSKLAALWRSVGQLVGEEEFANTELTKCRIATACLAVYGVRVRRLPAMLISCMFVLAGPSADAQDSRRGSLDLNATILAAEQGDAYAQSLLGGMYYFGNGVAQDYGEAVKWYRLAALQGDLHAQSFLGSMYAVGNGVPQDYDEAAKWYRLAAEQGDAGVQQVFGLMYYNGEGVARDYVEAAKWLRLAAEQGDTVAQGFLGAMYYNGEGVSQDYDEAYKWLSVAAEQGIAIAQRFLGLLVSH